MNDRSWREHDHIKDTTDSHPWQWQGLPWVTFKLLTKTSPRLSADVDGWCRNFQSHFRQEDFSLRLLLYRVPLPRLAHPPSCSAVCNKLTESPSCWFISIRAHGQPNPIFSVCLLLVSCHPSQVSCKDVRGLAPVGCLLTSHICHSMPPTNK